MRNDQSDSVRRPHRAKNGKGEHGTIMSWPETKGDWQSAYSGGMGVASTGQDDEDLD